jgi:hypothetical protein
LVAVALLAVATAAVAALLLPGGGDGADPDDETWRRVADGELAIRDLEGGNGPAHCDWQDAYFLYLDDDGEPPRASYARDPDETLPSDMLTSAYRADVPLPDDAGDTGYRLSGLGWELFLSADSRGPAYVRTPDGVEAWPRVAPFWGCD